MPRGSCLVAGSRAATIGDSRRRDARPRDRLTTTTFRVYREFRLARAQPRAARCIDPSAGLECRRRGGGGVKLPRKDANPLATKFPPTPETNEEPPCTAISRSTSTASGTTATGRKGEDVINPATEKPLAHLPHASKADLDQALEAAKKGFALWRTTSAYDRAKIMRKAADLMRERHDAISQDHGAGAGQGLRRGARRGADLRRHHRLVRRGRPPQLRPHRAGPRQGHAPARDAGAGRRRRGVHAVEFPGADAGPQDRRRARGRLLADPQGVGRDAGRLRRDGALLRRCRPAGGRAQSRVRRAGGSLRAPDRRRTRCARSRSPARSRSASISPRSPPRA